MHLQHPHQKESTWWALVLLRFCGSSGKLVLEIWNLKNFSYLYSDLWYHRVLDFPFCAQEPLMEPYPEVLCTPLPLKQFLCWPGHECLQLLSLPDPIFLQQYNLHRLWLQSSEVLLCLWNDYLKQTGKCIIWLLQFQLILLFEIFWILSSFSMDSWRSGIERSNLSPHPTAQIRGTIYIALKNFLQHAYNFQHILCTFYLSLWANASFAVRKLCDFDIETEVTVRLGTDVHCGL